MSTSSRAAAPIAALFLLVPLLGTGCIEHALKEAWEPTEHEIPPPPPLPEPSDGSLWRGSTASGSFLYFDRKARGPGDLVTVLLVEQLSAEGKAQTSLERQSDLGATLRSDVGLTDLVQQAFDGVLGLLGISNSGAEVPSGADLTVIESQTSHGYEGDGETNRESSFRGVVTCRVIEAVTGDLYRVYGRRRIIVNHELQLVTLEGLVRRSDIAIDNTVPSTQIADLQLSFDGIGVIDDEQRPPLFGRILSWLHPF
ncbi:MAG: flagellar basal body L-ring protein FlgH [Myxococcales bacterium]|nr:flagellar basal body L-ring protein FlgH [Myxococcales bacterium]